jgi:hypothetical protein
MSTVVQDRAQALNAVVEQYRDTPFAWGVHDCCMWAGRVVEAQRGEDPAARWRGTYSTGKQARQLIASEFGGRIENIPTVLGFEAADVLTCRRGWLVTASFPRRGMALGVCLGSKAAFAGRFGLVFLPMTAVRHAWKV